MSPSSFAFFDVDETLINLKSMFSFRSFYLKWALGINQGLRKERQEMESIKQLQAKGSDRTEINRHFYRSFKNQSPDKVRLAARAWYSSVRSSPDFFFQASLKELTTHQDRGVGVVLVSGSCEEILEPLAHELRIDHLLVNRLEVIDDRYSGELLPPQTIGDGKRIAIERFLANMQVEGSVCHGYGDHISDLPLLEAVGHPTVVAHDKALLAVAHARGWRVLGVASRMIA
jgi:HAD superfamily hydrolase (TIGR01490 family)